MTIAASSQGRVSIMLALKTGVLVSQRNSIGMSRVEYFLQSSFVTNTTHMCYLNDIVQPRIGIPEQRNASGFVGRHTGFCSCTCKQHCRYTKTNRKLL